MNEAGNENISLIIDIRAVFVGIPIAMNFSGCLNKVIR